MSGNLASTPISLRSLFQVFIDLFDKKKKQCDNARFLVVELPLVPNAARAILPFGMWLTDPPTATLFIANYLGPTFTSPYREAGLMVHVATPFGRGWHCCWMVMDDDTAMIYGRELLAFPKKTATIEFEEGPRMARARVVRRGVEVIAMEFERGAEETEPGPLFDVKTFNVGGMGQLFAVNPVWIFRITERIRESYTAKAVVTLKAAPHDPIASLVAGDPRRARIVATDVMGGRYLFPGGLAGPIWFARTFVMRYR